MSAVVAVDCCGPLKWLCDGLALLCFPCICCVSCLTCGCCGFMVRDTPGVQKANAEVAKAFSDTVAAYAK
jgi:hypothetical protein